MTTSTALEVISPEAQAYLDSLSTGTPPAESYGPTRLVINKKSTDENDVKRVIGAWHLEGTDKYYDGAIVFRPVRYMNKIIRYTKNDAGGFDYTGDTVYFNDFRDEIIDSLGGLALGRKFGRAYSEDEKAATKPLGSVYADVFGFATLGDAEPVPSVLRVRGGNLKAVLDAFSSVPKDKKYSQFNFKLEAYQPKIKNETTGKMEQKEYWSIKVTPDMSEVLPITPLLAFDAEVMEFIRETNHKVLESHKKNRSKLEEASGGTMAKVINAEVLPPNDLNDELPF